MNEANTQEEHRGQSANHDHSINVCFSTTNQILSKLIRWATKSNVSHCIITFHSLSLRRVLVMEAGGKGFVIVPWTKWQKKNKLVARYRLSADRIGVEAQCHALELMAQDLGKEYDKKGLLVFLKLFFTRGRKRIKNKFQDPNQLFCSEAVAKFLFHAGLNEFKDHSDFRPDEIRDAVKKNSEFFILEEPRTRAA